MNKKVWSVVLLCLTFIFFAFTVVIFVNTGVSMYMLETAENDISNGKSLGVSVLGNYNTRQK